MSLAFIDEEINIENLSTEDAGLQTQLETSTQVRPLQNIPPEAIDRWLQKRLKSRKLCDQLNVRY